MQTIPSFPPLLTGLAVAEEDLLAAAQRAAAEGADGGSVLWSPLHAPGAPSWEAAMILAPDQPLDAALTVIFALQMAAVDAIGALSRPELGVTWAWPDILLANGAAAGRMKVAAGPEEHGRAEWLAIALALDIAPMGDAPGETPDRTSFAEEACPDLGGAELTEVWARHSLLWLHRWMEGGLAAVEPAWRERAFGAGAEEKQAILSFGDARGRFLGVDEQGGLLLRQVDGGVAHRPLRAVLARAQEPAPQRLTLAV